MNQPPYPPGGPFPPGAPGSISVGGPSGIQIHGGQIHVGGMVVGAPVPHAPPAPYAAHPPPGYPVAQPMPHGYPQQQPAAQYPHAQPPGTDTRAQIETIRRGAALVKDNPVRAAGMMAVAGLLGLTASALGFVVLALPAKLILVPLFVSLLLFGGAAWNVVRARRMVHVTPIEDDPALEQKLLEFAAQNQGRVTAASAASAMGVTLAQADAALTSLVRGGYITVESDPSTDARVFVFPLRAKAALEPSHESPRR